LLQKSINSYSFLLSLYCNGDNKALAQLYRLWLPELYLIAFRYTKQQENAEDVIADCFEKLLQMPTSKRTLKFIEEDIQLKALLIVMVKNKSLDVLKTKKNRNRIVEGIKHLFPIKTNNASIENLANDNFNLLLSCLPEKESVILKLHVQGFTLQEISQKMNIAEKTVRNILASARKKVRKLWLTYMN
jgi:RNA polymerase sigma-70 factor (ECF subfamily)